ncbi:MAG: DEAD/DEAH box helicase [Acidimicrobiales bacterium]
MSTGQVRPRVDPVHGFRLDPFQVAAIEALDRGESVLVAAPTGSGKTVVAEHAVAEALASGRRAFYTTPIKALSNQKYHDLVRRHGRDQVGLLTGDNAINGDAPVVVMTTEVLRNMIYARSGALEHLRVVVLDEVHYLQDAYRGPVWEEVIVHLPAEVRLVCLSATVSNAGELADWLTTVRGTTTAVVETARPVALENHFLAGDRLADELRWLPLLVDGHPNPDGARFDRTDRPPPGRGRGRPRRRWFTPDRLAVVEALRSRDLLPALYFIFSRAACDDAVQACVGAGLRLTDAGERSRILEIVEDHVHALRDEDLAVLGYQGFLAGLEAGIAGHHAGMVPPFKEAVEQCFVEGLVRVVFATETLALGINMPARTVVIEKLTKFTGEHHEALTPGQYTQLTGRAGRRGIDDEGHAVVLWSPWTTFGDAAALAASRSFELRSAFRPTYNMAANLVRRYQPDEAHHLLNLSFAQFRADRSVVRLETRLARAEERLAALEATATCELGDVRTYARAVERADARRRAERAARRRDADESVRRLRPGDVLAVAGRQDSPAVVLSVAERKGGGLRVRLLTSARRILTVGRDDLVDGPDVLGHVDLPVPYAPGAPRFQREVLDRLGRARLRPPAPSVGDATAQRSAPADGDEVDAGAHPVAACPDLAEHLRALRRADRARREVEDLRRQVQEGSGSLARRFDRVLQLLEGWGYLDGWALTAKGERLVRLFHESDLLVAEALAEGVLDGLDPAALAGLVSCFTYEHRSPVPPEPAWFPSPALRQRVDRLGVIAADLQADEQRLGLPLTRPPDPTFFALAHAWAAGTALDLVLEDEDLSGGDFVRNVKQLVDLLRQIGDAAVDPGTADTARRAADAVFRGVVAASAEVGPDADDEDPTPATDEDRAPGTTA